VIVVSEALRSEAQHTIASVVEAEYPLCKVEVRVGGPF
jgi:hypothetical protein